MWGSNRSIIFDHPDRGYRFVSAVSLSYWPREERARGNELSQEIFGLDERWFIRAKVSGHPDEGDRAMRTFVELLECNPDDRSCFPRSELFWSTSVCYSIPCKPVEPPTGYRTRGNRVVQLPGLNAFSLHPAFVFTRFSFTLSDTEIVRSVCQRGGRENEVVQLELFN